MYPITLLILQVRKLRQISLFAGELDLLGGEVMCHPAALFERFVCFPHTRMIESFGIIALGVVKRTTILCS
jgi:hypothetical protein